MAFQWSHCSVRLMAIHSTLSTPPNVEAPRSLSWTVWARWPCRQSYLVLNLEQAQSSDGVTVEQFGWPSSTSPVCLTVVISPYSQASVLFPASKATFITRSINHTTGLWGKFSWLPIQGVFLHIVEKPHCWYEKRCDCLITLSKKKITIL